MSGLAVGKGEIASRLNSERRKVQDVLNGALDEPLIAGMAEVLGLCKSKLLVSARKEWSPSPLEIAALKQFNLPFGSMLVNSYVLWCEQTAKGWVFDTGPDSDTLLDFLEKRNLSIDAIFLTHTHGDHIACLEKLKQKTGAPPIFVHKLEAFEGANLIDEGFERQMGSLSLRALHTYGHSVGGTTYLVDGLEKPVAISGDSFSQVQWAGYDFLSGRSSKQPRENHDIAWGNHCLPGHGPMTTIDEERKHNPFFPSTPNLSGLAGGSLEARFDGIGRRSA